MANLHLSYEEFKYFYGDLGITYWTKYNYLDLDYVGKYNVWDEVIGFWNQSLAIGNGGTYNNPNAFVSSYIEVLSNKVYYKYNATGSQQLFICYYDETKTYISGGAFDSPIRTPNNCKYIRVSVQNYGTTYKNDVRVYETVLNLARVDLGTLNNWNYNSAKNCFFARYDTGIPFTSGGELNVAYCSKYEQATAYNFDANSQDMSFSINNNRLSSEQRIWVRDTTCLTTDDIKNNNIGISIVYKIS